ncbi:hypothetical protein SAMN02746095_03973 [Acidocella aminolytica 101 = DSM 11237]|nr:hypothetical protein [Acidocella aminolytica]SHF65790.1 hypothetical protein SAMN02746095_03973 [Acidocella aminolytica 101 = DSM 11237]
MSIDKELLDHLMAGHSPGDLFVKGAFFAEQARCWRKGALSTGMDR